MQHAHVRLVLVFQKVRVYKVRVSTPDWRNTLIFRAGVFRLSYFSPVAGFDFRLDVCTAEC